MTTSIEISRMQIHARHGVLDRERRVGNLFEVSVKLYYDFLPAANADDITGAINYAEVVDVVNEIMASPCLLLETVALKIKTALETRWPQIQGGKITVAKLRPPFSTVVDYAAATLEW